MAKKMNAPYMLNFPLRTKEYQILDGTTSHKPIMHVYSVKGVEEYIRILKRSNVEVPCVAKNKRGEPHKLGDIKKCFAYCIFCSEIMEFEDIEPGMVDESTEERFKDNGEFSLRMMKSYRMQCMADPVYTKELTYDDANVLMNNQGKDVMLWPSAWKASRKVFQVGNRSAGPASMERA